MTTSTPAVITRYFAAQAARDFDTLVTLFADDAIVIDEGKTRRGTKEDPRVARKRRLGLRVHH